MTGPHTEADEVNMAELAAMLASPDEFSCRHCGATLRAHFSEPPIGGHSFAALSGGGK